MHDVYISYARYDQPAAQLIADRLRREGFSVYLDEIAIVSGESWSENINYIIRSASAVIALLSSHSAKSKWVGEEIQHALEAKRVIVAVLLDKGAKDNWLWPLLATRQSIELDVTSPDAQSQLDNLVRGLSAAVGKRNPAPLIYNSPLYTSVHVLGSIALAVAAALGAVVALLIYTHLSH